MRALRESNWVIGGAREATVRLGLKRHRLQDAEVGDLSLTLTKRCESVSSEKVVHDYGCLRFAMWQSNPAPSAAWLAKTKLLRAALLINSTIRASDLRRRY